MRLPCLNTCCLGFCSEQFFPTVTPNACESLDSYDLSRPLSQVNDVAGPGF